MPKLVSRINHKPKINLKNKESTRHQSQHAKDLCQFEASLGSQTLIVEPCLKKKYIKYRCKPNLIGEFSINLSMRYYLH